MFKNSLSAKLGALPEEPIMPMPLNPLRHLCALGIILSMSCGEQVVVRETEAKCGNEQIETGERCDDGNLRHDDNCPIDCRSVCGDGERSELEACDDGNQVDGDGSSAQCELP